MEATQVIAVTLSAGAKPSGSSSSQRQDSRTADRVSRADMTENLFCLMTWMTLADLEIIARVAPVFVPGSGTGSGPVEPLPVVLNGS